MNKWIKRVVTTLLITAQFVVIPTVSAKSLEDVQNQKKTVETELEKVQKTLNEKLSEASELTISLDKLAREIEEQEVSIQETEQEIEDQEVIVEKRYDYIADQLKIMQKSEVNHNIILGLFQAESLSDLINRLYTASVLTNANEEHLAEAHHEFEKLNNMKDELLVYKEELDANKSEIDQQKEVLDEKLSDLKSTLAGNQDQLAQLNSEEKKILAEQEATRAAEAAKSAEAAKVAETAKTVKETKPVQTASSDQQESPSVEPAAVESSDAGSWMTFESTAYSYNEPGLSTKTASGVNLLQNPRVVAVDPRQIPLGSLVEVEGMGVYLAADTGGAIKGKIIDVHFSDLSQVRKWGRRNVRIRVLN